LSRFRLQSEPFYECIGFGPELLAIQTVYPTKEADVFQHREILIQGEFLAHVADVLFDVLSLPIYVESGHRGFARRRLGQAAQHPHRRGFARAVGTQETEYLPFVNLKRNFVGCDEIAEPFGQFLGFDYRFRGCHVVNILMKQSSMVGVIGFTSISLNPDVVRRSISSSDRSRLPPPSESTWMYSPNI